MQVPVRKRIVENAAVRITNKEKTNGMCFTAFRSFFCRGDEPKSALVQDLGDRLQSRNAPFGASGDYALFVFVIFQ